jgi:exonuclease III
MKIISWNVNSVRARLENILNYIKDSKPDILLLQEIKTVSGATFKRSDLSTSTEGINNKLGSFGYAFSNVNPNILGNFY